MSVSGLDSGSVTVRVRQTAAALHQSHSRVSESGAQPCCVAFLEKMDE